MRDNTLDHHAPNTYVSHTTRGLKSLIEFDKFLDDKGTGELQVFLTCREFSCKWNDTTSLSSYLQTPVLYCEKCGSVNLTAEWLEINRNGHRQYCVPDQKCGPGFPDIIGEDIYYYAYHRFYQVER